MTERIFIFQRTIKNPVSKSERKFLVAFPESEIKKVESRTGSENCFLMVNDQEVDASFEELVESMTNSRYIPSTFTIKGTR
jgi:hypothetical protein